MQAAGHVHDVHAGSCTCTACTAGSCTYTLGQSSIAVQACMCGKVFLAVNSHCPACLDAKQQLV